MIGEGLSWQQMLYRTRQFFFGLTARPAAEDLAQARRILSAPQMALFLQMQPGEQAHSLLVMRKLLAQGETDSHLLTAALLHDVGKIRGRLRIWERSLIVIGKDLFPARVKAWGRGALRGWQRAFVIAEQHPEWGASLAQEAGVSPQAVALIRYHQSHFPAGAEPVSVGLLRKLQIVDDES